MSENPEDPSATDAALNWWAEFLNHNLAKRMNSLQLGYYHMRDAAQQLAGDDPAAAHQLLQSAERHLRHGIAGLYELVGFLSRHHTSTGFECTPTSVHPLLSGAVYDANVRLVELDQYYDTGDLYQRAVDIEFDIPSDEFPPRSNHLWGPGYLTRVFVGNVVTNGVEALTEEILRETPDRGLISISATRPSPELVSLTVSDRGKGIEPRKMRLLREGMVAVTGDIPPLELREYVDGLQNASHLGLGVYACTKVLADIGGSVEIASEYGRGTTISLSFPSTRSDKPPKFFFPSVLGGEYI